jgi:hypothetical protein
VDDDTLLRRFEDLTLPFEQWTHRTHVKVAWIYLSRHPLDEAIGRMRAGIKVYNAANDVPEGPMTGYNETTTQAFMRIMDAVRQAYEPVFPAADADTFCDTHPQLMSKHILRLFYSPERRMHPDAKARYVAPDLAALPCFPPPDARA